MTLTLADLYAKQGLVGKAREILRRVAEGPDPVAAEAAKRRLSQLPSVGHEVAALQELLDRVRSAQRRG